MDAVAVNELIFMSDEGVSVIFNDNSSTFCRLENDFKFSKCMGLIRQS